MQFDTDLIDGIDEGTRAFNIGCDARIAGIPLKDNPYHSRGQESLHNKWRIGWMDVAVNWGKWDRRRAAPLPEIIKCR